MAAEVHLLKGKRFKILPPPDAQVIPEKFVMWSKEVARRMTNAGISTERIGLCRMMNEHGHLFLGYTGDYEMVARLRNVLCTDNKRD